MKTIALTLFAAALGMAQSQSGASATPAETTPAKPANPAVKTTESRPAPKPVPNKAAQQKPKAPAQAQTIPAGATLVEPFTYRYTDSDGKVWMYRQTPFGISKWEEASTPAQPPVAAKSEPVKVTDLGDSFRFEKKTPFGGGSWVRKKTELTDEEKALVAGQPDQSARTAAGPGTKSAEKP